MDRIKLSYKPARKQTPDPASRTRETLPFSSERSRLLLYDYILGMVSLTGFLSKLPTGDLKSMIAVDRHLPDMNMSYIKQDKKHQMSSSSLLP